MEPCRILSLDGGGVRGTSALLILERLMEEVQSAQHLDEIPRPCEYFDLIGGTSTGGIIAIMLGRLGMTVDECIRAYRKVAERAFTPKRHKLLPGSPSGEFSATELVAAIRQILREHCVESACIIERGAGRPTGETCPHGKVTFRGPCTKTVVLAITKDNVNAPPTLFKTYDTSTAFQDTTIWQVARATSAATTFFKPIRVGRNEIEFIDAGFGYNNPCEVLIDEAHRLYPGRPLRTLSIGTGLGSVLSLGRTRLSILNALKKMATTSQKVAYKLDREYGNNAEYFRFNVERGLDDIGLEDWTQSSKIAAHTMNYLQENQRKVEQFAQAFAVREGQLPATKVSELQGSGPVSELSGSGRACALYSIPFLQNPDFTGREKVLGDLIRMLFDESHKRVALVGLGGMGKTQVALQLSHNIRNNRKEWSVIWLHAISLTSFEKTCRDVVRNLRIPCEENQDPKESLKIFLASEQAAHCVLIIDNADDADVLYGKVEEYQGISDYLPQNSEARILVTTRSQKIAVDMAGSRVVELLEMGFDDTKALLGKLLWRKDLLQDEQAVTELLKKLAFLPLAVAQAAQYINVRKTLTVSKYLQLFRDTDKDLIHLLSHKMRDEYHYNRVQEAVATTWIISFTQISKEDPFAVQLLSFIAWIEPKSIPRSILPSPGSEIGFIDAVGVLCGYGFLSKRSGDDVFDMHRLVHLAIRVWLDDRHLSFRTREDAICHLLAVIPPISDENSDLCRSYLPHALRAYKSSLNAQGTRLRLLGNWAGECLLGDAWFGVTGEVARHKVIADQALLVEGHKDESPSQEELIRESEMPSSMRKLSRPGTPPVNNLETSRLLNDLARLQDDIERIYQDQDQASRASQQWRHMASFKCEVLVGSDTELIESRQRLACAYFVVEETNETRRILYEISTTVHDILHRLAVLSQNQVNVTYERPGPVETVDQLDEKIKRGMPVQRSTEMSSLLISAQHDLALAFLSNEQVKDDLTQAARRYALARAYQNEGRFNESVNHLEYVVAARKSVMANDDPRLLGPQHALARAREHMQQLSDEIHSLSSILLPSD